VISTKCQASDIAKFEFAFICTTPQHEVQKHSFGVGGFDEVENFDTEVQCLTCTAPPTVQVKLPQHHATAAEATKQSKKFIPRKEEAVAVKKQHQSTVVKTKHQPVHHHSFSHVGKTKKQDPENSDTNTTENEEETSDANTSESSEETTDANTSGETTDQETAEQGDASGNTTEEGNAESKEAADTDAAWLAKVDDASRQEYGPENCLKLFKRKAAKEETQQSEFIQMSLHQNTEPLKHDLESCVLHSECTAEQAEKYQFGLTCETDGATTDQKTIERHIFGENSFEKGEWFDTLIECTRCLSMEDTFAHDEEVDALSGRVSKLEETVKSIKEDVEKLKTEDKDADATGDDPALLHRKIAKKISHSSAHRHKNANHVVHHRREKENDDDDSDSDSGREEDNEEDDRNDDDRDSRRIEDDRDD